VCQCNACTAARSPDKGARRSGTQRTGRCARRSSVLRVADSPSPLRGHDRRQDGSVADAHAWEG
jgi:hypothetical protein